MVWIPTRKSELMNTVSKRVQNFTDPFCRLVTSFTNTFPRRCTEGISISLHRNFQHKYFSGDRVLLSWTPRWGKCWTNRRVVMTTRWSLWRQRRNRRIRWRRRISDLEGVMWIIHSTLLRTRNVMDIVKSNLGQGASDSRKGTRWKKGGEEELAEVVRLCWYHGRVRKGSPFEWYAPC